MCNVTGFNGYDKFDTLITQGMLRAIVGINIGCVVYMLSEYMKTAEYTKTVRVLLAAAEFVLYILVIINMDIGDKDCVAVNNIMLVFAVAITASGQSATAHLFNNGISRFLGSASLYVYLCQSPARQIIYKRLPDISYGKAGAYIITLTAVFTAVGMICVSLVRLISEKHKGRIGSAE
jgi:peptidoglycan/LPS O-acetylase OafA/YrhL